MDGFKSTIRDIVSSEHYELSKLLVCMAKGATVGAVAGMGLVGARYNMRQFQDVIRLANSGT